MKEMTMRRFILATAAAFALAPTVFVPLAIAQTYPSGSVPMAGSGSAAAMPATGGTVGSTVPPSLAAGGPSNCGTPDEPKACPPMPRHSLNYYPANK
jgi:hypothetical protein